MELILGLPRMLPREVVILIVVDHLTKTAHFIPMRVKHAMDKLATLYVHNVVRQHDVRVKILLIELKDVRVWF